MSTQSRSDPPTGRRRHPNAAISTCSRNPCVVPNPRHDWVCSNQRRCIFGEVETDHVNLSAIGKVVERNWLATADLRPGVVLDEFIVMPNHFHAVLSVGKSQGTHADSANLGSVVRGFKGSVTSDVRRMLNDHRFEVWQRGYYDHVIRNTEDLRRRREYTRSNPVRWAFDRHNPAMEEMVGSALKGPRHLKGFHKEQ